MKHLSKLVCIGSGMMMFFDNAYGMNKSSNNEVSQISRRITISRAARENAWNENEKDWKIQEIYDFLAWHSHHIKEDQATHRNLVFAAGPEVSSPESSELFFILHGDEAAQFFDYIGGNENYFMLYLYYMGVLYFPEIEGKQVIYPLRKVTQNEMHELFKEFKNLREMFLDRTLDDLQSFLAKNNSFGRWAAQSSQVVKAFLQSPSAQRSSFKKWEIYCFLFAKYKMGWATPKSKLFEIKEKK